jgi:alkylation response protein AidB-like acyl-CoA dehydrogenase
VISAAVSVESGSAGETFRAKIRCWIESNQVDDLRRLSAPEFRSVRLHLQFGAWVGGDGPLHEAWATWVRRNEEAGYICPWWPEHAGGRGWDPMQQMIWTEELARAEMPRVSRGLGEHLAGPAIFNHGSAEQRQRFLPPIIDGTDSYIQGFSEPDAGSDLASLRTTGIVDGDELVISGQKIWTTVGSIGNRMFLLCRTDKSAPSHSAISYVLIDLEGNDSIQVRPMRQLTGDSEFTEEFLDEVRIPLFNVIGGLNNGWRVAMSTLSIERGGDAATAHLPLARTLDRLLAVARSNHKAEDPVLRQDLIRSYIEIELIRFAGLRVGSVLAAAIAGDAEMQKEILRVASTNKLNGAEVEQRLADLAVRVVGPAAMLRPPGEGYPTDEWVHLLLWSRALTIQGGTAEVQRNILGERVLGLPREPPVERRP